jgi:hypothetical protein
MRQKMIKNIDFLNRLFTLMQNKVEILEHLKSEFLINDDMMQGILTSHHTQHASKIVFLLKDLENSGAIQLLSYEWTILPTEFLKLTIVSKHSKKEFIYAST